ncbi:MAG TPA: hypothetical protein VMM27_03750 [Casimicrobiaceae bacterium]|nr:hypothetical protein [Casimicrobiaceae bacterium]
MNHLKPLLSSAPAHSLLSARFRYTSSAATDIRKTFAKIRRQQAATAIADDAQRVIRKSQAAASLACGDYK